MPSTKTAKNIHVARSFSEFIKVLRIFMFSDSSRACRVGRNKHQKMRREQSFHDSMRHTNHGIVFTVRKFTIAACRFKMFIVFNFVFTILFLISRSQCFRFALSCLVSWCIHFIFESETHTHTHTVSQ